MKGILKVDLEMIFRAWTFCWNFLFISELWNTLYKRKSTFGENQESWPNTDGVQEKLSLRTHLSFFFLVNQMLARSNWKHFYINKVYTGFLHLTS